MTVIELREQAVRAERLAWAVRDATATERLLAMSQEYRRLAAELDMRPPTVEQGEHSPASLA